MCKSCHQDHLLVHDLELKFVLISRNFLYDATFVTRKITQPRFILEIWTTQLL
jgi:hypothetical protein